MKLRVAGFEIGTQVRVHAGALELPCNRGREKVSDRLMISRKKIAALLLLASAAAALPGELTGGKASIIDGDTHSQFTVRVFASGASTCPRAASSAGATTASNITAARNPRTISTPSSRVETGELRPDLVGSNRYLANFSMKGSRSSKPAIRLPVLMRRATLDSVEGLRDRINHRVVAMCNLPSPIPLGQNE
jgi:hypothetical protein